MLVDFKNPWFAPSLKVMKDKIQSISGQRFKKGVQEVDEALRDKLPKSAKVLSKAPIEEKKEPESTDLKDYDQSRLDSDRTVELLEDAEKQYDDNKKARQDRMAHARAAKGAKKGNKTNK